MWKLLHSDVSDDLHIEFFNRGRTGIKAKVPTLKGGSSIANRNLYDNSFAVIGPRLWNCLPTVINSITIFEHFKDRLTSFLMRIPDKPPTKGYSTSNSNSIRDWKMDAATTEILGGHEC
jgi:hypothetical protein